MGDLTLRMQHLVLIRRQHWCSIVVVPRLGKRITKLTACFHQKRSRSHGRIAHLQGQNLLRLRVRTKLGQNRLKRRLHNRRKTFTGKG